MKKAKVKKKQKNQLWLPKRYLLAAAADATPPLRAVYSKVRRTSGRTVMFVQTPQFTVDSPAFSSPQTYRFAQ